MDQLQVTASSYESLKADLHSAKRLLDQKDEAVQKLERQVADEKDKVTVCSL